MVWLIRVVSVSHDNVNVGYDIREGGRLDMVIRSARIHRLGTDMYLKCSHCHGSDALVGVGGGVGVVGVVDDVVVGVVVVAGFVVVVVVCAVVIIVAVIGVVAVVICVDTVIIASIAVVMCVGVVAVDVGVDVWCYRYCCCWC